MDAIQRPHSFQQIDYRIRPNKSTERRMISELFRRLSYFEPIENYRYIGFGSTTFTDFILFHKTLNIKDMVSIEKRREYEARFEFNRPFDCIKLKIGDSNTILPSLSWDKHSVVWLDYDDVLVESILNDIAFLSLKAVSGNMIIVTVNATGLKQQKNETDYTKVESDLLAQFKQQIDREVLPIGITGKSVQGNQMAKTYHRLISDEIADALHNRNGFPKPRNEMLYRQLLNITYSDGARMLTVGGIFYRRRSAPILKKCNFENLGFVTDKEDPFEIKVPIMTPLEHSFLNKRLPKGKIEEALEIGLTQDEINNYNKLYRYCPSYAEIEVS